MTSKAPESRLFWGHTLDAMFVRAFPPAAVPGLVARYRALGLDLERPLLPAYDYAIWRQCLAAQREAVLPGVAPGEGAFQQGARYVAAYFERTLVGGPLLFLLRTIGPRRSFDRMARNFRSANNFSDVRFTVTDASSGELWVNDVFSDSPDYIRGMLIEGMRLAGTPDLKLETLSHEGDAATFRVRWGT
jgi:uncharacterized protein (TIGR02265 family)